MVNPLKVFPISFNCDSYKNIPNAYQNCLNAKKETSPHERSHMINAMCRRAYFNDTAHLDKGNCIQVGWDDNGNPLMTWIPEPVNATINGLEKSGCVPGFLKSCTKYKLYLIDSQVPVYPGAGIWTNITYLFDEWGAYNIGGAQYLQTAIKNQRNMALNNVIEGPIAFVVIGASSASYLQKNDPAYFKSDVFKSFLKKQIELSTQIVKDALAVQAQKGIFGKDTGEPSRGILINFKNSNQAKLLKQMYGEVWFDATFNITF
jgi:hypothetical protein